MYIQSNLIGNPVVRSELLFRYCECSCQPGGTVCPLHRCILEWTSWSQTSQWWFRYSGRWQKHT